MQPYINQISNFDAKDLYTVEYKYLGAERVLTNELSIREDVENSSPIYARQSTKFDKEHNIPKDSLINGKSYLAKIRVKLSEGLEEENGIWSDWSPEISFLCLANPTFVFTTLDERNYVYNDDVMMQVIYRQEQGEKILNYQFSLLDQNKTPIEAFPTRLPSLTSPNVLEERFSNLVKGRLYYIKCQVNTLNGINYFETHEFIPHFASPSLDGIIEAQNQYEHGQILVQSFLKQTLGIQTRPFVPGHQTNDADNYTYLDSEWVIIPPDKPLQYTSLGMAKASDWIAKVWCKNVLNGLFLDLEQKDGDGIGLKFYKHDNYITCEKTYLGVTSRTISNIVPDLKLKEFYLYIKVIEFRVQMTIITKDSIKHTAWAYSADGTDGFTTVYPNLNLLEGTKDFSGTWTNSSSWVNDGTYKGLTVKKRTERWGGIYKTFTAPKDGTYTFSAYVKSSGDEAKIVRIVFVNGEANWNEGIFKYLGSNFDWLRDSFTITLKAGDIISSKYEISGSGTDSILWTAGHKWEEGSIATPYMQSASEVQPSDYPNYIGEYYDEEQSQSENCFMYNWKIIGE